MQKIYTEHGREYVADITCFLMIFPLVTLMNIDFKNSSIEFAIKRNKF